MGSEHTEKLSLFESATLRLTGWYVIVLMTLSLLFSMVLYSIGTNELNHALGSIRQGEVPVFVDNDRSWTARQERMQESNGRLIVSLVLFNVAVLVGGTALSYVLARRTLQPIQEAHEAQSRFASDAAHELRTPLAVMQTEIEVGLRDKKPTAASQVSILKSALEEVSRLRTLTDRLLRLASQQKVQIGAVEVESAAVDAVTRVVTLAQSKRIEIDNQVGTGTVQGHAESVVDILGILLDNAIKYSPEKSKVTLTSSDSGHTVSLRVSDEGPGVSTEDHAKIFERFYRADQSRSKDNVEGHGLGLSLAKRLTDEMRGSLTVESDGLKGSTFTLTLPK